MGTDSNSPEVMLRDEPTQGLWDVLDKSCSWFGKASGSPVFSECKQASPVTGKKGRLEGQEDTGLGLIWGVTMEGCDYPLFK